MQELEAAVKAAETRGLEMMVHANGKIPVRIAVVAGCHSIEHGFFMGTENLKLMAEKKVVWVPTAFTMKAYAEHFSSRHFLAGDVCQRNLDHQLEQLAKARRLGVRVALGTDAGSIGVHHGEAVVSELKLLLEAGFSVPEAVQCATGNGAELLKLEEMGHLAEGKSATFIVVKGKPINLPDSLRKIESVYIKGKKAGP